MRHVQHLVFAALTLLTLPAWAYDFEVDGIYYQITNSTAPFEVGVTNNNDNPNSYSGHVVIPNQVYHNGNIYAVTSILFTGIGHGAFWDCTESLSIELPNSIKEIRMGAFWKCTGLTTISIPQSVEHIDRGAFAGCSALTTVNYNAINCVITTGAPYVFAGCSSVSTLNIGEGVEVIPEYAFRGMTNLSSVTIPNSVTSIGKGAFNGCITSPTSIIIPNSVASIGESAFNGCTGITSISLSNALTTVENRTFFGCTSLISITIPSSVISIGENAFSGCSSLTNINLSDLLTSIGDYAFSDCNNLTNIDLPNSLTIIGNFAFGDCSNLTDLNLPNSLTDLGYLAFYNCTRLTNIILSSSLTSIIEAFKGCISLTEIYIPNSVTYIDVPFSGCAALNSIIVAPDNPIYDSRDNCNAIIETATNTLIAGCKATVIPNTVTSIGDRAFEDCSGLTYLNIPNSVVSIGQYAFQGCTSLISIYIPNTVISIENNVFSYCSGLASIIVASDNAVYDSRNDCNAIIQTMTNTLIVGCQSTFVPNSVAAIGGSAFRGCSELTTISIPNSVTSIGSSAFFGSGIYNDDNNWENDVLYINNCLIRAKDSIAPEYELRIDTRLIADQAFLSCKRLTSIELPNSLTVIGKSAFVNCSKLISITLPSSLIDIGSEAFRGCSSLYRVIINSDYPPSLGYYAFSGSENVPLYVPCGQGEAYANAENWSGFTNIIDTELPYVIEVQSNDEGLGSVQITHHPDCESNVATIVAQPINGNLFLNWTVDGQVVSTANPYTFVVEDDIELVANFCGTGVDEETEQKVTLSPNPTKDLVNVECENMKGITLYTLDGRVASSYKLDGETFTMDMTSLPQGIYILRIETKEGVAVNKKIIKE